MGGAQDHLSTRVVPCRTARVANVRVSIPPLSILIHHSLRLLTLAASLAVFSTPLADKTVKVFVLAGQSNMEGKGQPAHLDTYPK